MVYSSQTKPIAYGWVPDGPVLGAEQSRTRRSCRALCFGASVSDSLYFHENKCTRYLEQFCH